MSLDRILAWADEDDRSEQSLKVRGFQLFLQLHVSARLWFTCFPRNEGGPLLPIAMASAATIAFALGFFPRLARPAVALTAATMFVKLAPSGIVIGANGWPAYLSLTYFTKSSTST